MMDIKNYKYGDPFKFKSLKTFASTEQMLDDARKYRRVFEKSEITYLRWELRFYNKLFDEEDWKTKINFKVYKIKLLKKEEICNLEREVEIEKSQNEVKYTRGWGNDEVGVFWQPGDYIVEAYINDKKIGEDKFFIQNFGLVSKTHNPYFDIESINLFEGNAEAWQDEEPEFLKVFDKKNTRYVWIEYRLKNKLKVDWNLEMFVNIYDNAGNAIAKLNGLYEVLSTQHNHEYFSRRVAWGSKEPGTWENDSYRIDLVFMDTLVASLTFEMSTEKVEGKQELNNDTDSISSTHSSSEEENLTLDELMKQLNELIGLKEVKAQIQEHINYIEFLKLRKERGFNDDEQISLHSVFTGNPGTGKTTVVKLLGKIYQKMGLLSRGHIHEVDRADLVGEFIGQTAPKVHEAIDEARGGILFIDEAYSLARSKEDKKDYGLEVIEILVKEMSDGDGDIAIMVAGYPKEMHTFLDINPGLKSRFKYYFNFADYTPDELMEIAELAAKKRDVTLEAEARNLIDKILLDAYRDRDSSFGNARFAYSLIDEAKVNLGLRLVKLPNIRTLPSRKLSLITEEDIKNIKSIKEDSDISIPIDEDLLRMSLNELNQMIGIETIKNEINDTIKLVRYYKETGKDILNQVAKHTVFKGNPGTGKTTVARIISKIYRALGLLERGHLVESSREDLVAGYVGQTAIKTKERIAEAIGGVLFIDEAYSLSGDSQDNYGKEAIEVILKTMEDRRGDFVIIAAGYPDNMDNFLESNPGLKSRFDRTLHFYDYKPEVLHQIAVSMFENNSLTMNDEASNFLRNNLQIHYEHKDKYFGNARFVRKIVEQAVKNQHLRMASMPHNLRTEQIMSQIAIEDLKDIKDLQTDELKKKKLGF